MKAVLKRLKQNIKGEKFMKLKNLSSVILAAMMAATSVPCAGLVPYSNMNAYAVEAESAESGEQAVVAKGKCGENLTWKIYDFDKLLVISGEGTMTNWESFDATPWAEYSDYIQAARIENGVANIGENAFSALKNEYFDNGCYGRFDIENPDCIIADSPYVFPESVAIGGIAGSTAQAYAEKYNREFEEIREPDSGEQEVAASSTCGATLTWSIYDDKRLVIKGNGVMDSYEGYSNWEEYTELFDTVEYSGKLENYGEYAFYNCKNLKEFEIAPVIGAHAFEGCSNISGVKVPKGFVLNEIGDYAFYGCDNLGMLIIGNPECVIADSPYVFPEDMVIYGVAGSTAQAYAEKYNREFKEFREPGFGEQEVVAEGTCGENLTWKIYEDEKCLIVSGYGAMDSYENPGEAPWADYYNYIEAVRLEPGVENIGENTFASLNSKRLDIIIIENPDCIIPDTETTIPDGMTVGGEIGSTAQAYAEKYNREFEEISTPGNGEQGVMPGGKCGEAINWSFDENNGYLRLSGEGVMNNWASADLVPWAEYADKITYVSVDGNIESIGDYAFSGLTKLTDVQREGMANQITRIGAHAFDGCTSLTSTIFVYAEEIQDYAFYGCDSLEMIKFISEKCTVADSPNVFPEGITIFGKCEELKTYAEKYGIKYEDCRVLASGKIGDNINWTLLHNGSLSIEGKGDMIDCDGANFWGEYADSIKFVSINENVTSIGDYTFYNCKNLENITMLVNNEKSFKIGSSAFEGCDSLKSFAAPEYITEIEKNAFKGCETLEFVYIHNADCVISDDPIVFPESTGIYGHFDSTAYSYALKYDRNFLPLKSSEPEQELIAQGTLFEKFPYKLTSMGEFIVEGEGKLEDLTRWSIAFEDSEKVTSLMLSENITAIGAYNFFNCNNLGSMYIGKNVESIGDYAFYGCYKAEFIGIENPQCVIADSPYVFPKNTVIGGYKGSTAEAYAKKYNREFYAFPEEVANGKLSESITWRLNSDGSLYIEGEGDIPDCDGVNIWGEYADSITNVQFAGNFRKIGDYAFSNCKNLQEIYGATGVIGEHAFEGCEKLENVNIYNVEIGDFAFSGCDNLDYIYIDEESVIADSPNVFPEDITIAGASDNVKAYAEKYNLNYEDCTLATEGKLDENYTWYLSNNGVLNLSGEGNMRNGIRTNLWGEYSDKIEYAFFDIRSGSIGEYAFYNCKNLEEVGYGVYAYDSLKIGSHAFEGCEKLTSFGAFENVIRIGNYAFNGCDSLEYVSIFNPGCAIADSEFVFPENTVIYGYTGSTAEAYAKKYNRTFESWGEIEDKFIGEGKLSETIEYTLTGDGVLTISGEGKLSNTINDNMCGFWGSLADKINTIELSDDITEIGDNMFAGCENLVHIFTNANVIGEHAFEGCTSLLPVTLKEADKIGDYAFYNADVSRVIIYNPECEIADSPYVFPEDTIIYGYENSTAEEYARKYERMFLAFQTFLLGDVNDDGKIDSADASAVLAEYAASQTGGESTLSKDAADVNDDGLVNSSDASAILEYYAKASIGEEPSWNLTDVTK